MPKQVVDPPKKLKFKFGSDVNVQVHLTPQVSEEGKSYRLEVEIPEGKALFTYEEFVRWAQTMTVMLNPKVMLEE